VCLPCITAEGVGNGAAAAILFARERAEVALVNRRADRAEALAERIRSEGGAALAFASDVTEPEDVEAMAAFAVANFGRRDSRHDKVGIAGRLSPPETIDLADRQRVFEMNLTSALLCGRSCTPQHRPGKAVVCAL
jgi:NAD(P)-dependent dehydrogenase (short-subunit alcohol dehydrogenase family)